MKKVMMALMLSLVSIVVLSQEIIVKAEEFPNYQGVVNVDGTAQDMYNKAKTWFAITYKSANDVIQLDDAANATIIGKGITFVGHGITGVRFLYTIKIEGRENRFRYTVTVNDIHPSGGTNSLYEEALRMPKFYSKYFEEFKGIVKIYAMAIARTAINASSAEEDW